MGFWTATKESGVQELPTQVEQLLAAARRHPAGRSSRTVVTAGSMRVTMIALLAGASLAEHESPGAATLQVLSGDAVLHTDSRVWQLAEGALVALPNERHGLQAKVDTVALLTVCAPRSEHLP